MTLDFSKEEWSLIAHACTQLAFHSEEMAEPNEKDAKAYFAIADKIDEARQNHLPLPEPAKPEFG